METLNKTIGGTIDLRFSPPISRRSVNGAAGFIIKIGGRMCVQNWQNDVIRWLSDINQNQAWLARKINRGPSYVNYLLYTAQKVDSDVKEQIDSLMNPHKEDNQSHIKEFIQQSGKLVEEVSKLNNESIEAALSDGSISQDERRLLQTRIRMLLTQLNKFETLLETAN